MQHDRISKCFFLSYPFYGSLASQALVSRYAAPSVGLPRKWLISWLPPLFEGYLWRIYKDRGRDMSDMAAIGKEYLWFAAGVRLLANGYSSILPWQCPCQVHRESFLVGYNTVRPRAITPLPLHKGQSHTHAWCVVALILQINSEFKRFDSSGNGYWGCYSQT